jgi:8-oxo-dGTP pyrophosphatase MutT (NUDIX family)
LEGHVPHAAGILLTHGDRALFLRRSDKAKDHAGEWCCPGGSIEAGETPEQAARREMQEETGYSSGDLTQIDEGDGFVTFRGNVDAETDPTLNDEHTEFQWAPLSDPPKPLHPGVAATLKKLLGANAMDFREYDQNNWFQVLDNPLSKVGVYQYSEASITKGGDRNKMVGVYRPAEELGSEECVNSFRLMPWTDDHPSDLFGDKSQGYASTEEKGVRGVIGEQVYFKGDTLYGNLKVFSEDLARKIASGKRELSCGYHCEFVPQEGVFEGTPYQYVQRNMRGNHISSVKEGRMGSGVRVLDSAERFTFALDLKELSMDDDGFRLGMDDWSESDHPRKDNGEFGNGSGGGKADPHTAAGGAKTRMYTAGGPDDPAKNGESGVHVTREYTFAGQPDEPGSKPSGKLDPAKIKAAQAGAEKVVAMMNGGVGKPDTAPPESPSKASSGSGEGKKAHPFVATFTKEYGTGDKAKAYLEKAPKEKIQTALRLIDKSGSDDPDSQKLKKILERELDNRGGRGDAKDSKENATKVAGTIAAEKGMTGHNSIGESTQVKTMADKDDEKMKQEAADRKAARDSKRSARDSMRAKDSMTSEEEAAEDAKECAEDAEEEKDDDKDESKEAKDRGRARDRRAGARDARKSARDKAKDDDEDDKDGKGMDAAEVLTLVRKEIAAGGKALDANEVVKLAIAQVGPAIRKEESAKASLYGRVSPMIGAFDHAEMTHVEMATYSLDKLGAPKATDPVSALDFYLAGRSQVVVEARPRLAMDSASGTSGNAALDAYLN